MAWDKDNPANDDLLINHPANQRANNAALELGTDASLQITNAKVAAGAAIVESKLTFNGSGHGHSGTTEGKQISLTAAVTGTLPRANGGTSFRAGDLMLSSNTSAPTGWTDVSATYTGKMIRISSGTPENTGGSDTDSITLSATHIPAHTHAAGTLATASDGAHTHTPLSGGSFVKPSGAGVYEGYSTTGWSSVATTSSAGAHTHTISGATASYGSGNAFTVNTVPAYVQERLFKMN